MISILFPIRFPALQRDAREAQARPVSSLYIGFFSCLRLLGQTEQRKAWGGNAPDKGRVGGVGA